MRKFESIVMSEKEPIMKAGTLWLKNKRDVIYNPDSESKMKVSRSILYYGNNGWESFIDFDTRYDIESIYDYNVKEQPIELYRFSDEEKGIVTTTINYNLYDGNRNIANSSNLVLESGLKKHVDDLQRKIDDLTRELSEVKQAISNINQSISTINGNINSISGRVSSNTNSINSLSNRVSSLENN